MISTWWYQRVYLALKLVDPPVREISAKFPECCSTLRTELNRVYRVDRVYRVASFCRQGLGGLFSPEWEFCTFLYQSPMTCFMAKIIGGSTTKPQTTKRLDADSTGFLLIIIQIQTYTAGTDFFQSNHHYLCFSNRKSNQCSYFSLSNDNISPQD